MELWELDQAIKAVCPIDGVRGDKTIFFRPEATAEERAAAQAIADAFDFNAASTQPDVAGFKVALIGIFSGDFLAINSLYAAYPLFKDMLDSQTWAVVTLILTDAKEKAVINQGIYDGIKAALPTFHIPVDLA